tara:strand:+ start:242 stop:448 length:207 start_codon:yes stop_codon:yes gene_type:complete
MNDYLLEALVKKLEGEIAMHKANIQVYLDNPAGIGEHPQILEALETEVAALAEAVEKKTTIEVDLLQQ